MKHYIFFIIIYCLGTTCIAQNIKLKIIGDSLKENAVIDSLHYNPSHVNTSNMLLEINEIFKKARQAGYINVDKIYFQKNNDFNYESKLKLGNKIKLINISIGQNKYLTDLLKLSVKNDTVTVPYTETESFLKTTLKKLEKEGYAFAKVTLVNLTEKNNQINAELEYDLGQKRKINKIEVKFRDDKSKKSFPYGHLKQINRKYNSTVFNNEVIKNLQNDFEKFEFVNQIKKPEVLFTNDTTKIYLYLTKKKSNAFDGFLGFANNDRNKLVLNGYLNLKLENALKVGEQFSIFWKSDGADQKTFNASLDLPYIFGTAFGIKADLNIFRQDSIFQNTKKKLNLGYLIDYETRVYVGYLSTASTDVQKTNSSLISNYNNSFITTSFEYSRAKRNYKDFEKNTALSISLGYGNRTNPLNATAFTIKQNYIYIKGTNNIYFNSKNYLNINYQKYFLKSNTYIINELYRFGGARSIRGFAENSLQANFLAAISTEYRYQINRDLYIHSILDYCYYEDKTINVNNNIIGIGAGLGLITTKGILKFSLSNGLNLNQGTGFQETILSLNYDIKF